MEDLSGQGEQTEATVHVDEPGGEKGVGVMRGVHQRAIKEGSRGRVVQPATSEDERVECALGGIGLMREEVESTREVTLFAEELNLVVEVVCQRRRHGK
jgi:hypothetical protein